MIGGLHKSASTLAILAAAGLLVGGVAFSPKVARAADLGGDCCADLEERVAELEATTARKGNKKVSLTITGRVAASMTWWTESGAPVSTKDNGPFDHSSDLYFGDHTGNGPQIILKGEGKISSDLAAGYYIELGVTALSGGTHNGCPSDESGPLGDDKCSGDTQASHQTKGDAGTSAATYVYLTSKQMGQLQLGRVDNAGDQYFANFNGAWMGGQTANRAGGSFNLRDKNGDFVDGLTYGNFISTLEPGGENGLRYISPSFGGFSFNASVGGDDQWGAGANYSNTFKTVSVKAGIGYGAFSRVDSFGQKTADVGNAGNLLGISAGIKESGSGLFLEAAWSRAALNTPGANDPTNWLIEGGWAKNVSGMGDTTIYGIYDKTNDAINKTQTLNGTSGTNWTFGIDQKIDAAASHLFLTYENLAFDNGGLVFDDIAVPNQNISTLTAGMSIEF
jgi:Gram-negative porin